MKIELISHSRLFSPQNPGIKYSEVSTAIAEGAIDWAKKLPSVSLTVTGPKNYHQDDETISLLEAAVLDHKNDVIVFPFSPPSKADNKIIKILQEFDGDEIIAVNVPANPKILKALDGKITGYAGPCEPEMGRRALRELVERSRVSAPFTDLVVTVVAHEKGHYGHSLRIKGIKKIAKKYPDIDRVHVIEINPEDRDIAFPSQLQGKDIAVIALGVRGLEAVRKSSWQDEIQNRLVGMDLNPSTSEAINASQALCTIIQHPFQQGAGAIQLVTARKNENYTEVYYGPTVVDFYNRAAFD